MKTTQEASRRSLLKGLLVLPCIAMNGCGVVTRAYTFYFKLTLTTLFEGAEHFGSTVIKGRWVDTLGVFDAPGRWVGRFAGDPILIDLGAPKALIAMSGSGGNGAGSFKIPIGLIIKLADGIPQAGPAIPAMEVNNSRD